MRYYVKADVKLKLGDSFLFPCTCDVEFGAVLADEATGSLFTSYIDAVKPQQSLSSDALKKLEGQIL